MGAAVACVLYLFSRSPLDWPLPALLLAIGHAAFAYYLWQVTVRLSRNLTLPELRTTLRRKIEQQEESNEKIALVDSGS